MLQRTARYFSRNALSDSVKPLPGITKLILVVFALIAFVNLLRGRDVRVWILLADAAPLFVVVPGRGWPRALVPAAMASMFAKFAGQGINVPIRVPLRQRILGRWAGVCGLAGWACPLILCVMVLRYMLTGQQPSQQFLLLLFLFGLLLLNLAVSAYCWAESKGLAGVSMFGVLHGTSLSFAVYAATSFLQHGDNSASADAAGAIGLLTLLSSRLYWKGWNVNTIPEALLLARTAESQSSSRSVK